MRPRPGITAWVRGWELWRLPTRVRSYVLGVEILTVTAFGYAVWSTVWRLEDLLTFLALLSCGALCVESSRRIGMSFTHVNGRVQDMLSVWTLPVILLLPPVYALVAPFPLYARVLAGGKSQPPVKQVFNAAAIGISGFVAATTYARLVTPQAVGGLSPEPADVLSLAIAVLITVVLNFVLVAGVVRLASPRSEARSRLLPRREDLGIDAAENGMGILVAACWTLQPLLLLAALPPVLLLQRSIFHAALRDAARTDAKTSLANSVYWREIAGQAVDRATRYHRPLALLLIDLDHFKDINDTYGHLVGDQVLTAVAHCLAENVREHDVVGRFGGEEFVVLLPDTGQDVAGGAAERLRTRVERLSLPYAPDERELRVTISVGVVVLDGDASDLDTLLGHADGALYAAKRAGRNQVRTSPDPPSTPPTRPVVPTG